MSATRQSALLALPGNLRRQLQLIRLLALLLTLGVVLTGWFALQAPAERPPAPQATGPVGLTAPASAAVGSAVNIVLMPPVGTAEGAPATLVVIGSYGVRLYHSAVSAGAARFTLPATDTRQRGALQLIGQVGGSRSVQELTLTPQAAIDPVTPLIGARSIVADGQDRSMTVVIPFDAYGNPVAEETPVRWRALRPDGLQERELRVRHLLAWGWLTSGTRAGKTQISTSVGNASGPAADLLEVPGWPAPFTVSAQLDSTTADGRQLVSLRSSLLRDRYSNVLPDGTSLTFVITNLAGQQTRVPAQTIAGVAAAMLQAPPQPGDLRVIGTLRGVESASVTVSFTAGPAIGRFDLRLTVLAARRSVVVEIGPLLAAQGEYVPDGTEVEVRLWTPTGELLTLRAASVSGRARATFQLSELGLGVYRAEAIAGAGHGAAQVQVPTP